MLFWEEVLWILGNGWNNTSTQRKRSAPTVLMFTSGKLVGLFLVNFRSRLELCVVNRARPAQFLFDLTRKLFLCGGSERDPLLSEVFPQILCKVTARPTKDGVM